MLSKEGIVLYWSVNGILPLSKMARRKDDGGPKWGGFYKFDSPRLHYCNARVLILLRFRFSRNTGLPPIKWQPESSALTDQELPNTPKCDSYRHSHLFLIPGQQLINDVNLLADVAESKRADCAIAEFTPKMEAATASQKAGIAIMIGAPNSMHGGSNFSNVSTADLVERGYLKILSSDYVPLALLRAAVKLGCQLNDMVGGIATVTAQSRHRHRF